MIYTALGYYIYYVIIIYLVMVYGVYSVPHITQQIINARSGVMSWMIRDRGVYYFCASRKQNGQKKKGEIYFGFLHRLLAGCCVHTQNATYTHMYCICAARRTDRRAPNV